MVRKMVVKTEPVGVSSPRPARGFVRELRVLIAEEMEFVASRLSAQLEGLGHHVLGIVRDQAAVLASAQRLQPDLLLSDLHLPPIGAIEAARALVARSAMPVVLIADYGVEHQVRRAGEAGVLAHLVWPSDLSALEAAIRSALARFGEFQVLREQAGDLSQALRARVLIEQAKVLFMQRLALGEAEAFQYLRRRSLEAGRTLGETAARRKTGEAAADSGRAAPREAAEVQRHGDRGGVARGATAQPADVV